MDFILREEMATLNPFHVANTPMGDNGNPRGIIVHSTAAPNARLNRYVGPSNDALNNTNREARTAILGANRGDNCWNRATNTGDWTRRGVHRPLAVHAWIGTTRVGTIATYQTLPWNIRGRHAGDPANATHIGFEICEFDRGAGNETSRAYLNAAYKEAVQLCAFLCRRFRFDPMNERQLIDHWGGSFLVPALTNHSQDVDGPAGYFNIFDRNMGQFRTDVQSAMNA
jgi:N-acetylmuramoyl-L-alanine amidase